MQAIDHAARVRWLDAREQLRRQRVESWEREHSESAGEEQPPQRKRLEAVADLVERAGRATEATAFTGDGGHECIASETFWREKGTTVRSIGPNVTVYDALRLMAEHGIGALLVLEDGKPIGLFSERDYSRKVALRGLRSRETPVSAIMSSPVLTISPDASVQNGLSMMTEKYIAICR